MKEFGEGVERMFKEMSDAGLPAPEYNDNAFLLNATIRNGELNGELNDDNGELNGELNNNDGEINGEVNGNDGEVNGNDGKVNGELNPALLYLNKSELAVYHLIEKTSQKI